MTEARKLDPRDAILQAHTPAVMVPRHGAHEPLAKPGHRFLVASDGLWLEVARPWLHAIVNVGYSEIPLPYGDVGQVVQYAFAVQAMRAIERHFLIDAVEAFPNECAAWGVYDNTSGQLEYWPIVSTKASPANVTFERPRLRDHQHLAIDIHSHGALPAGFSTTDDEDDAGEVKLAIVVGNIGGELSFARRLCLNGYFLEPERA